jgi:hypothetical protein
MGVSACLWPTVTILNAHCAPPTRFTD